jgi:GntR family transcriptional regulator / MocR family aminotransferase
LSPARRMQLLALAQRHRWLIIEDDYDSELHFEGRPVAPLASADPQRNVVYIGTLSKILAPGLRLGFLAAPPSALPRLLGARFVMDRQGDLPMEAAVAELIDEGELQRHVRRMRAECLARRDALCEELTRALGGAITFTPPRGGMALWAEVDPAIDATAWCEAAEAAGLVLSRPSHWAFAAPSPNALRLAYSELRRPELRRAAEILAQTLGRASATSRSPRRGSTGRRYTGTTDRSARAPRTRG